MSCRTQHHVLFKGAGVISSRCPGILKPFVGTLLTSVPKSIKRAQKDLEPIIIERLQKQEKYGKDWPDKPNDCLSWLIDSAPESEKTVHGLVRRILTVNFAAIHTSSMAFTDALYALAAYPQYADELREEIESVVQEHGWSKASQQRMLVSDRRVMKDFTFSDGNVVPAGSVISVPNWAVHHDERYFEDPYVFKPFRFAEMREDSKESMKHQMVTPTSDHLLFGVG
ncbi:hypothetical protein MPER_06252 [Moniliophthora perniciosa FA553]|nr:hypothetical protein MPER_06252 [Moniliophthora perniciosa FA553]